MKSLVLVGMLAAAATWPPVWERGVEGREGRGEEGAHAGVPGGVVDGRYLFQSGEIPYFARRYNVSCSQCHVAPPKLNEFGEAFAARGYSAPGLEAKGRTWPFAIWLSGRSDSPGGAEVADDLIFYLNRLELVSGGEIVAPWLSYFVEWRPVSRELRSDGTIRDRSGRFEDLFVSMAGDRLEVVLGQFRQVTQVDVSQRISLSEPLVLSASLPGRGNGSAREVGLRSFAPSARSPAVRVAWTERLGGGWRWTSGAAMPFPGELSIPLTRRAREEASNELEWSPKGVFLESYVRRGLTSVGAHAFVDGRGRSLANAVLTGSRGRSHWAGMAGLERYAGSVNGRWSVQGELFPTRFAGLGMRVEDRAGDGVGTAVLPYINLYHTGGTYMVRLTVEQRVQRGRHGTAIELGTVF